MSLKRKGECCSDPWPQLMTACARVVEIYAKIFNKPDLLKISKCLKNVRKNCLCKSVDLEENSGEEKQKEIITDPELFGLAFIPQGLTTEDEVKRFYALFEESVIPKLGTKGESLRNEELNKQNPLQDEGIQHCKFVDAELKEKFESFVQFRNEFDRGYGRATIADSDDKSCSNCKKVIPSGSCFIISDKMKQHFWHPNCFTCAICKEFLQDLKHCVYENNIFCNRHYSEKLRLRCSTCDELIFNETCTKAMGKSWHTGHFCCNDCKTILTGKQYAQKNNKPYCLKCYETAFADVCFKCNTTIAVNAKYLIYKKKNWHETCFNCKLCNQTLVKQKFFSKDMDIFCEICHEKSAPRCDDCSKTFKLSAKTVEYKGKQFHEECFKCDQCKIPIRTRKFASKDENIFCNDCYQDLFGTKCSKCKNFIIKGGVTYRDKLWHNECFICSNCPTLLSGITFTSNNNKPYCITCYGMLFAKKCFACREPINGEGAKFVNYDNHHWHDNCFFCAICRCNLGGKGFIMDADHILCPNCARSKFNSKNSNNL